MEGYLQMQLMYSELCTTIQGSLPIIKDLKVTICCERSRRAFSSRFQNTNLTGMWLVSSLLFSAQMHSGLQVGFQQMSLLYILVPKGPDYEQDSINDFNMRELHVHQYRHVLKHTDFMTERPKQK